MKVEVFGKEDCAICKSTKRKLGHFVEKWGFKDRVSISFVDMDTVDGMAEAAFRDVLEVPTTIISTEGKTHGRWGGIVPPSEEVKGVLSTCF